MIFSQAMKSVPGWYQQKRYDAVSETLVREKERIENIAKNPGEEGEYIDKLVIHSLCRMIEICDKKEETMDFLVFYYYVGGSLRNFDSHSEEKEHGDES